ncbi:HAMP domain-containing sensor histidine kinase [Solirubrobacter soli]|uniref:HAMP domain-containing sensor histidine kinase n=1 Tax=Solirubrobacter soli TaxID=363832 RepID=UPI0004137BE1|nr:HAMP domain-containing sensor histidine kinase [Solirubrobacter soli]
MRSLRTWLAVGLAAAIVIPAAAGLGAWVLAGDWQSGRQNDRLQQAVDAMTSVSLKDWETVSQKLTRIGVEAEVTDVKPVGASLDELKAFKQAGQPLATPGLLALQQSPEFKTKIAKAYRMYNVSGAGIDGTVFVPRESAAVAWAVALLAAGIALALVLVLAVSLLQRWVLRPLAQLADGAERIAGGELAIAPVSTRAREVAQVGEAMGGMAAALETALGTTTAAEQERRFLLTAIAHDLRTPLFTLRGSLEAIERGIGDEQSLTRAQDKAAHLDRLVGDLFAFSRAEYRFEAHSIEPVDLAAIARRAAETVDPGSLRLDVFTNGPVRLEGDPVALQRVLTNLLDNALRHAHTRVELRVDGPRVDVTDDGPGFAQEDLPHVFEPLYRGDKARGGGGAGLGLAIARRLARAHGGDVDAANAPEGGARVTVQFQAS